jgi:predicted lipoprotein
MALRPNTPILIAAAAQLPAATAPNQVPLTLRVIDTFIIPLYRQLAAATATNEAGWKLFTETRQQGNFAMLRAGYTQVADAWARAQIVKTGPISLFLRYERFAYWPEARNATQRALDALLASRDPKTLTPESLATNSVAGQGLTALERLLYEGADPANALRAPGPAGERRAQVGYAISRNLNIIAQDVLREWTAPDGVRAAIAANKGWRNLFADSNEAVRLLLTDLVGAFRLMHDVKLLPVLGANIDAARPRLAEAWRSGRPARDLRLNLLSAHDMASAFAGGLPAPRKARVEAQFPPAEKALNTLPADLGEAAADPARRAKVEAARDAVKKAQTALADMLSADLGITLGFNALDGD